MKIKEIKSKLSEFDNMELPDKDTVLGKALRDRSSAAGELRLPRLRRRPRFIPAAAVGFVLLCAAAFWISHTTVTQAKNYRDAVEFFEKYELPSEDLSKDEITEVYFDIIKGNFSLEKTEQVIHKRVLIHDITQDITTSEQIDDLWKKIESSENDAEYDKGVNFEAQCGCTHTEEQKSTFTKYENGAEKWKINIDFKICDFYVAEEEECIILSGHDIVTSYDKDGRPSWAGSPKVAAVDMQGAILWEYKFQHSYEWEGYIGMAACEQSITVLSREEDEFMITSFDYAGNCLQHIINNELLNFCENIDGSVQKMECYGEYIYIKIVSSKSEGYWNPKYYIIKINHEGHILETINYTADGMRYDILDMIEFNGKLYLNGFAYESKDGEWIIDAVEKAADEIMGGDIFGEFTLEKSEELTQRTREIMSAVLLVCDAESGTIQEAYSVKGSKGGKLSVDDEKNLIWEVGSISSVYFNPYMSSHIFDISCQVYKYTFDGSGMLIDSCKTNKKESFWL